MRCVHGAYHLAPGVQQPAEDLAEPIAAIARREQVENITPPRLAPASGDRLRRGLSSQRAFELIGSDEDAQRHEEA